MAKIIKLNKNKNSRQAYFIKEASKKGDVWKIMIIETGVSKNGFNYSPKLLKDAIPLFEGVKVFAFQFGDKYFDHLPNEIKNPNMFSRNVEGWIDGVKFEKVNGKEGLTGMFHPANAKIKETIKTSWDGGKRDLLGFSIDAKAEVEESVMGGKRVQDVKKIHSVGSVDLVTFPSAGGEFLRLVASINKKIAVKSACKNRSKKKKKLRGGITMNEELKKAIIGLIKENPDVIKLEEGVELDKLEDDEILKLAKILKESDEEDDEKPSDDESEEEAEEEDDDSEEDESEEDESDEEDVEEASIDEGAIAKLLSALRSKKQTSIDEAVNMLKGMMEKGKKKKDAKESAKSKEVDEKISKLDEATKKAEIRESQAQLKESLASESKLPQVVKDKLMDKYSNQIVDMKSLKEDIKIEKDVLARLSESGNVVGLGFQMGDDPGDQMQKAMDLMVDPSLATDEETRGNYKGIKGFRGLQEAWIKMTGDTEVRGNIDTRITEALTTDFPQAFGTSMHRRMVREYRRLMQKETWSKLVSMTGVNNFKQNDIIRWGGLGTLPTVAENGSYTYFTSPSEETANYSATKRGKLLFVTREMIKNDDLRTTRIWPVKMAQSANRTLAIFVYDLIVNYGSGAINGGTIYDSAALYTTAKGNLTTGALNANNFDSGIIAMANQAEADSGEVLGIQAQYLLVPYELRSTAKVLVDSEKRPIVATTDGSATGTEESVNPNYKAVEILAIPNYYLRSDQNNWYLIANPSDIETIELGFIDNQQEPEILLQDNPTVATVFTQDRITYKVRHEYGGAVVDYRGFYGGIVAGLS